MRAFLTSMLAAAILAPSVSAQPLECLIECVEPSQNDPKAASSCNCAERYCPPPFPGAVWGWNESTDSCGPVPDGDQCAGLDVTCVSHYTYRWNGVDTCQCLPINSKRSVISHSKYLAPKIILNAILASVVLTSF